MYMRQWESISFFQIPTMHLQLVSHSGPNTLNKHTLAYTCSYCKKEYWAVGNKSKFLYLTLKTNPYAYQEFISLLQQHAQCTFKPAVICCHNHFYLMDQYINSASPCKLINAYLFQSLKHLNVNLIWYSHIWWDFLILQNVTSTVSEGCEMCTAIITSKKKKRKKKADFYLGKIPLPLSLCHTASL